MISRSISQMMRLRLPPKWSATKSRNWQDAAPVPWLWKRMPHSKPRFPSVSCICASVSSSGTRFFRAFFSEWDVDWRPVTWLAPARVAGRLFSESRWGDGETAIRAKAGAIGVYCSENNPGAGSGTVSRAASASERTPAQFRARTRVRSLRSRLRSALAAGHT